MNKDFKDQLTKHAPFFVVVAFALIYIMLAATSYMITVRYARICIEHEVVETRYYPNTQEVYFRRQNERAWKYLCLHQGTYNNCTPSKAIGRSDSTTAPLSDFDTEVLTRLREQGVIKTQSEQHHSSTVGGNVHER